MEGFYNECNEVGDNLMNGVLRTAPRKIDKTSVECSIHPQFS